MCGEGACMAKGVVHDKWGHVWQRGHAWQSRGMHSKEVLCGKGGMCVVKGGHAWQGMCMAGACVEGGHVWQGGMHALERATEAGGTHTTGMHSCSRCLWISSKVSMN